MHGLTNREGEHARARVEGFQEILQVMPERERAQLSAEVVERGYAAGEPVFRQGECATALYCVLSGWVKIVVTAPDGRQLIVAPFVRSGEIFGEIAVLDGGLRTAGAIAGARTRLALLRREALMCALASRPEPALALIGLLCKRLRHVSHSVETSVFLSAPSRLARCLLSLANQNGFRSQPRVALGLRFSQQELASMIGTTRELVNKLLKSWERDGCLTLDRGCVVEVIPGRLAKWVDKPGGAVPGADK